MRIIAITLAAVMLSACAMQMPPSPPKGSVHNPYVITITWEDLDKCKVKDVENDTLDLCPADTAKLCVNRSKFIEWRSENPSNQNFEIFFDPLQPSPLKSGNGKLKRKTDDNAPIALYKYSIVGDGCDPNGANTYDPHIRIVL